jgi:hypothetical protein
MKLDDAQRFDLLKLEMGLIQSTLDKYDDLIFRNRNWFITLWMGIVGLSFTINATQLPLLAIALSILYLAIEGMMRHQYWYKYVLRYRSLRDAMNDAGANLSELSLYDLTNKYSQEPRNEWRRILKSFFKLEPLFLYTAMALAAYLVRGFITEAA